MDIKRIAEERFWHTVSKRGQLEIAIKDIEEWLKGADSMVCPFSEEWEGGCSLCITFMQVVEGCPCPTHGVAFTREKAKEVLNILKSLPKGGEGNGEVYQQ